MSELEVEWYEGLPALKFASFVKCSEFLTKYASTGRSFTVKIIKQRKKPNYALVLFVGEHDGGRA